MKIYAIETGKFWDSSTLLGTLYSTKSKARTKALEEINRIDENNKYEVERYPGRNKIFKPMEISCYDRDAWTNGDYEVSIKEFKLD